MSQLSLPIPPLGLGTWKGAQQTASAVETALRTGYRHIDCALAYNNEPQIGEIFHRIFNSPEGPKREEVWITSKLWNTFHRKEDVLPAVQKTLHDLQLSYLDLYLMHYPIAFVNKSGELLPLNSKGTPLLDRVPILETWRAMEDLVRRGLVRHIGVSNFPVILLEDLLRSAEIPPAVNQIELHPYLQQPQLLRYCALNKIHVTAYSPLGSADSRESHAPDLLADPTIHEIARKHHKTPAQICIRWALQRGVSVIPKSVTPARIRENFDVFAWSLDQADLDAIKAMDRRYRYVNPANYWDFPLFD